MYETTVLLNTINKIVEFVNIATKYEADFDLQSGKCVVDGKSVMGIFMLNTNVPHKLTINKISSEDELNRLKEDLKEFEA